MSIDLNALLVFAAVADTGGFTAAADKLGMTKAKVSLDISRLEAQLGVSLFSRTTRRVALTDAGHALYARCVSPLQEIVDTLKQRHHGETELFGSLRITCTVDQAAQTVASAVAEFAALHPGLQIELRSSDRVVDLVKEGVDVALRMGWLRDSTLRAVQLGQFEQHVVAAPRYLQRVGRPDTPQALADHDWVALTLLPSPLTWKFTSAVTSESVTVRVKARLRTDSSVSLRALIEGGIGISVVDELGAREGIRNGRLQRVLVPWALPQGGIYAVFPPGRHVPGAARAFVAHYRAFLARAAAQ